MLSLTSLQSRRFQRTMSRIALFFSNQPKYALILIAGLPFTALIVFFVIPLLNMLYLSLLTDLPPAGAFTFENYATIFAPLYTNILIRTLILTSQTTILVIVFGYALAYSIVRFSRYTSVLLLLVILPFWTNYIVRMYAWINILQSGGALSWVLNVLGIVSGPYRLLYTHEAVLIGLTYVWLPLAILPFYASLQNLDNELIEASKDLGAGPIKTFVTITLPLTFKGILAGVVLVAIPAFGAFITPALLGGTDHIMIGMVIDRQFNEAFNWPFGAALGIFVTAVVILTIILGTLLGGDVLRRSDDQ